MNGTKSKSGNRGGRGSRGRRRPDSKLSNSSGTTSNQQQQPRQRLDSEMTDDHCHICLNRIQVFAVGRCNHPVCGVCSTRLRVICKQGECSNCRQDMPMVYHTTTRQRFEDVEKQVFKLDRKFGICFENDDVEATFRRLLEHRCPLCKEPEAREDQVDNVTSGEAKKSGAKSVGVQVFAQFHELDKHTRVVHDKHYCHLCTKHLNLFSSERRLYSREELKFHMHKGDSDDSSHRGHPLCQFCNSRFVDTDELFRHVRKDHFFCHFCDSDGKQLYFSDHHGLRAHFRDEHYVCEEGSCINETFTSAFRSDIDLKAHQIERHRSGLSKAEARLARTVELDFNFSRPVPTSQAGRRRGGYESDMIDEPDRMQTSASESRLPDLAADFPSLENSGSGLGAGSGGAAGGGLAKRVASSSGLNWSSSSKAGRGFQEQDFPSLPGSTPQRTTQQLPLRQQQLQQKPQQQQQQQQPRKVEQDFPSLSADVGRRPDSLLSNFRSVDATPHYRTLPGQAPAWQPGSGSGPAKPSEPAKKPPDMKKFKEAPAPVLDDDFPSLSNSQNVAPVGFVVTESKKKKKNKNKGFMIGDDPLPSAKVEDSSSSLKGASNLQTAADLIFKEDKKAAAAVANKTGNKKKPSPEVPPTKSTSDIVPKTIPTSDVKINRPSKEESKPVEKPKATFKPPKKINNTSSEDFPSLGGGSRISSNFIPTSTPTASSAWSANNSTAAAKAAPTPPTTSKSAPPGFSSSTPRPSAPPGFSSSGSSRTYPYQEPSNFENRNIQLLSLIKSLIGGKSLEFNQFKTLSSRLRSGDLSAKEYHEKCLELIEKSTFEKFFPQLIALLPDIKKQKELFNMHQRKFPESELPLAGCPTCGQVLLLEDIGDHIQLHSLDQDFPLLSLS